METNSPTEKDIGIRTPRTPTNLKMNLEKPYIKKTRIKLQNLPGPGSFKKTLEKQVKKQLQELNDNSLGPMTADLEAIRKSLNEVEQFMNGCDQKKKMAQELGDYFSTSTQTRSKQRLYVKKNKKYYF